MTASLALADLVSLSPSLASHLPGIERAAASEAPVLILGEPGTGRSTLARALHGASSRAAETLVEFDPGAIPGSLFEAEFFGYQKGAFTGAEEPRPGRVALAQGGTLILDQVQELPLAAQPKLLRLLSERHYAPLGGTEVASDVRFIAVGSADLKERVLSGAFRPDLFYRLEVLAFRLPSLAERRADLHHLVDHFLADLAGRFGRPGVELAPAARAWILDYPWPGNLRELRNVLERALILAGDGTVLDPPSPATPIEPKPRTLAEVERDEIVRALAYTRGHMGRAAEALGISRKALWQKRRRHGLP